MSDWRLALELKQRIVQELVPGKQITLAHVIANPDKSVLQALKITKNNTNSHVSIGVLTVTPAQTAVILADVGVKVSGVSIAQLDCNENGSIIFTGSVSEVQSAISAVLDYAKSSLNYEICNVSKT